MKRSTVVILGLAAALIASNVFWILSAIDSGITATYRDVSLRENHEALAQTLAVMPVAARVGSTRADVLAAATRSAAYKDSFEKDGYVWVGQLGFKFDGNERVTEVVPTWDPF